MNPGHKNDPGVSQGPALDGGKAARPPEAGPKTSAISYAWPLTKRILRIVVGVLLVLLGLAALFTPLTPGSWLAVVGLEFLGLRVLLRNWLCTQARARPQSKFWRMACRIFSLGGRDGTRPGWWRHPFRRRQRRCASSTADVRRSEPRNRETKDE